MSHDAHQILTHGGSRKRKEPASYYLTRPPTPTGTTSSKSVEPISSNRLLAGYMAHEFLTKGTLFGQKFDQARAEAVPLGYGDPAASRRHQPSLDGHSEAEPSGIEKPATSQSYAEVASLLKSGGVHIPEVLNPAQLCRWIQM